MLFRGYPRDYNLSHKSARLNFHIHSFILDAANIAILLLEAAKILLIPTQPRNSRCSISWAPPKKTRKWSCVMVAIAMFPPETYREILDWLDRYLGLVK
jgi:hypothetical protein